MLLAAAGLTLVPLVWAWVVYPARMIARGRQRPVNRAVAPSASARPISIILATRDDDGMILRRLDNLEESTVPSHQRQCIVALDHSVAHRAAALQAQIGSRALVTVGQYAGKSSALNAGVAAATHETLLFVDSAQSFTPDTIANLQREMAEPWGALTATLAATSGDALMDRYWARELGIRLGQQSRHSIICVTGCAYLMDRRYWRDMPPGLICDDLWSTYGVITQGGRVGIVGDARVTDPRRFTREQEYGRRLRTMTGLLQFIRSSPEVLSPTRNPMWSDFLWHKLIRPATPLLLMLGALAGTAGLYLLWPTVTTGLVVAGLAGLGALVLAERSRTVPLSSRLGTLIFARRLMFMPLRAIRQALASDWDVWRKV